jgi:RNA polymerase sigma factor for flagellar operon FliA
LGNTAVILEQYIGRDRQPVREAVQRVLSRDDVQVSEAQLNAWAATLPVRDRPRPVRLDDALPQAAPDRADDAIMAQEMADQRQDVFNALETALSRLPDQDQVIIRLRYWEGLGVATIARRLNIEQKPLYRRLEKNLAELRSELLAAGLDQSVLDDLLPE